MLQSFNFLPLLSGRSLRACTGGKNLQDRGLVLIVAHRHHPARRYGRSLLYSRNCKWYRYVRIVSRLWFRIRSVDTRWNKDVGTLPDITSLQGVPSISYYIFFQVAVFGVGKRS